MFIYMENNWRTYVYVDCYAASIIRKICGKCLLARFEGKVEVRESEDGFYFSNFLKVINFMDVFCGVLHKT